MNMCPCRIVSVFVIVLVLSAVAWAQADESATPQTQPSSEPSKAEAAMPGDVDPTLPPVPGSTEPEALRRDPTLPSSTMRQMLDQIDHDGSDAWEGDIKPRLRLRGRVIGHNGEAIAAIDIDGDLRLVRSGHTITADVSSPARRASMTIDIHIEQITHEHVMLRIGADDQHHTLH